MSQSWDNAANMHELYFSMLGENLSSQDCLLVQHACADESGMNFEPITA